MMRYRLKIFWCWVRYLGRNVNHYRRLFRWWWRGADGHKPFDTRSMAYNAQRCLIEIEMWLERRKSDGD